MSRDWPGKTTSYRLYCQHCDAETVVRKREIDETAWQITSLHFHEGRCPTHATAVDVDAGASTAVATDGGQPTLEAFAEGEEVRGGGD